MRDLSEVRWKKPSRSGAGNNCVQIAGLDHDGRAVRDSKDPAGPALTFTAAAWSAFTTGVRTGEFES